MLGYTHANLAITLLRLSQGYLKIGMPQQAKNASALCATIVEKERGAAVFLSLRYRQGVQIAATKQRRAVVFF